MKNQVDFQIKGNRKYSLSYSFFLLRIFAGFAVFPQQEMFYAGLDFRIKRQKETDLLEIVFLKETDLLEIVFLKETDLLEIVFLKETVWEKRGKKRLHV